MRFFLLIFLFGYTEFSPRQGRGREINSSVKNAGARTWTCKLRLYHVAGQRFSSIGHLVPLPDEIYKIGGIKRKFFFFFSLLIY